MSFVCVFPPPGHLNCSLLYLPTTEGCFFPAVGGKWIWSNNLGMGIEVKLARALESWVRIRPYRDTQAQFPAASWSKTSVSIFGIIPFFFLFLWNCSHLWKHFKNKRSPHPVSSIQPPNTCIYNYLVSSVCVISLNWEGCLHLISIWRLRWVPGSYHCCVCQNVPLPAKNTLTPGDILKKPLDLDRYLISLKCCFGSESLFSHWNFLLSFSNF